MKKKIINIGMSFGLGIILFLVPMQTVSAGESNANGLFIVELINWIRLDPVSYAVGLGYDRETLLSERPWLGELLENKLPLLNISEFLNTKAIVLNDPVSAAAVPVAAQSDDFARTGEVSGAVSFYNFMDPKTAIRIVVDSQFKSELAHGFQGQRCILSSELDLAGAAFKAGVSVIKKAYGNAYYITAALGSSLLKSQRQILNMINQIRANPSGAKDYLSFSLDAFSGEYSPLFFDGVLADFVKTEYVDTDYYAIHAKNFGYDGYGVSRSSAIEVFPKTSADAMAYWIFSSLVLKEAKGLIASRVVFGRYFNQAGLNVQFVNGAVWDYARLTLVAGLGENKNPGYSRIYGLVHSDPDQNNVYTPGEGAENRIVSIFDQQTFALAGTAVTDNTGHFSVALVSDRGYIVQVGSGESLVGRDVFLDKDLFFALKVSH
ncbi:MAG: hypothetical protein KKC20_21515 [Proteobacteria bacterium]|nr:hypothetical protein [Pseudomonadota bacterium]